MEFKMKVFRTTRKRNLLNPRIKNNTSEIKRDKSYTLLRDSSHIVETAFGTMYSERYYKNKKLGQRYLKNTKANRDKISKLKGKPIEYDNMFFWF